LEICSTCFSGRTVGPDRNASGLCSRTYKTFSAGEGSLPNAFYEGITEALGDAEADLIHPIELNGQAGSLFMQVDSAAFVSYEDPATEVTFLGSLLGSIYTERITAGEGGHEVDMRFEHGPIGRAEALRRV
jgi:hypothetical protein